ncbi:PAS domain-containing hybrid sensor histidine kinase/response regulator [Noviherbaspirillum sp.]|uniref:PAS domain-containing hybrid sensor histidine kinase/response regulator n=1 Tax=Noviherbaspirillum sp. TaxID=1926288 RepID=UPI002D608100|nr:response regulator [Noviherbaspirillum sp.]HZW22746.1 response regulator [Noviherbaspirillum sp.]
MITSSSLTAAQLQGILSIADDAIISVDSEQRIILFNQGAERVFGWKAEEIIGKDLNKLLPPRYHEGHGKHMETFDRSGQAARKMAERRAIYAMRRDGTEFPAEASISKLDVGGTTIHTVILRDISARKAYERELEVAKERAEAAMQAKSMFLANMSHEIRTPLNAVIGMTSLLLNTRIDEEQRDYAQTIRASSEVLLTIINDILDYSKIEVGKLDIERQPFDLRRCIEESLDLLSSNAADKNINLAYFIDDSVPAQIVGDVTRLRQILVNLLSNSIKFTHRGEVVVSVTARQGEDSLYEITFSVKDTGIGIPEDRQAELFQVFTQVDASTTRKYGGTGLGLAISKRLAEVMGGRMWLESEVGVGSTFHFTITAEASGSQLAHSFLQERSSALAGRRVLIVDDNSTNRRILVKQSLLWGMVPSAAASAIEALDLVRHGHAFDVGILDMSMPEMDGLGLALEIRKYRDEHALPLIMLTSVANRPRDATLALIKFAAYLNKPIKPTALFDSLLHAMRIAPMQQAPRPRAAGGKLAETHPLKILVAEDNTVNQKVVQQLLAHLGYRADVVANGVEVLDALERQSYDVVLMDVQMPEMDGLEATRRLRARFGTGGPRVIAMTANAMPGDREKCLVAGMDAYVSKPVELDDLRSVLVDVTGPARSETEDSLPIIDRRRIDQLLELQDENNPTLASDIIQLFINDSPKHLQNIAEALASGSPDALLSAAHRFLSSIENLGAQRMRKHCMELERLGREGLLQGGDALHDSLRREFDIARQHLLTIVQSV